MPPRRKGKKSTQADTDADGEEEQSQAQPGGSAVSDIDLTALSELIPDFALENPSPEAIAACYRLILAQHEQLDANMRHNEELNAIVERKDVELDQALQDRESSVRELESSVETIQEELKQVKRERDEIGEARASLESRFSQISSTQSTSTHELDALRRRIDDTEREKRDLLGVVSRLKEDASQHNEDMQLLREDLKTARKERQEMEMEIRELRSVETSTKFKVETLTQQLQLAKDESGRSNTDLHNKIEEFSKYRREKHAEFVQLQSSLDSVTQTHNQTQSTLRSLQASHTAQTHQLSQALQKVQDLTGQLADQESKYSSEAVNLRRLIDMMEERESQAKQIVENIEKEWDSTRKKTASKEQALRAELEEEHRKVEVLEKQLDDTQLVMDKMSSGELPLFPSSNTPLSSRRISEVISRDDLSNFSPGLAMVSRMQKSGKTFTEVYAGYVRLQEELAKKNIEYDRMDRTLSEVLAQIEERAPALAELRKDYGRVQQESLQLAQQLTHVLADRDSYKVQLDDLNQKLSKTETENRMLEQQAEDLGQQIQALLRQVMRHDDPTIPADPEPDPLGLVPRVIDEVITNHLVLYRSIPQLQEQNRKMLQITRDIGHKMEAEEKEYAIRLQSEQIEAVHEAHEAIQTLQLQLENQQRCHQATTQAYIKERDALKTMLARYEQNGPSATLQANGHITLEPPSDLQKELEEIQTNFEMFRREVGVDTTKLREELNVYQREASQLGAALAKSNAKIDFLNERYRMAQEQYSMQARDYDELQKRNQQLYDQYTRLDIACNHANEELSIANSHTEQLRSECANLRAEKKIWEAVQGRLVDENRSLAVERSRLSDVMANVQRMHNDLEKFNEGDRRRIETQLQAAEAQAHDLRAQLSRERDSVRQITLQKELETQELRVKIERATEDLGKTRESLVAAETSQKHLQDRVNDLLKQVQTGEEKLSVYGRRTTSVAGSAVPVQEDVSKEQQLESEVAELRGSLKAAEMDLSVARSHVEQYQEISQASEAALATLATTHDEYKASTEAELAKRESDYRALKENLDSVRQDVSKLSEQNTELQQTLETEHAAFLADKRTLEDTIVDITNSESVSRTDQASRDEEIRERDVQLKTAEEKYSREVLAHAESIKTVESLKQDLNAARSTAREAQTVADTAQAKLSNSEESWKRQREALDKEVTDLRVRFKDLEGQNAVLHQHLESVSSQATKIRHAADASLLSLSMQDGTADETDDKFAELRAVVSYLRKEKGIVELQLDVYKQENVRQQSQIEHLHRTLQETRTALSEEREKAVESLGNSTQHSELLDRINQLNILRESNATLRAESDANARRVRQLEAQLAQLTSELEPLKEELRIAKAEVDEKTRQFSRLERENQQWKDRNAQLLTKYERIDPNDIQALKDEIDDLQIDARKYEAEKAGHIKKIEELEGTVNTLSDYRSKYQTLAQDSKSRFGGLNSQIAKLRESMTELQKQVKELSAERDGLKTELAATAARVTREAQIDQGNVKVQIETLLNEKADLEKRLAEAGNTGDTDHERALATLQQERDVLLAEKALWQSKQPSEGADDPFNVSEEMKQQLDAERATLRKALEDSNIRAKSAEERAAKLAQDFRGIKFQNDKYATRIAENEKRRAAESERQEGLTAKFKQEQEEAVTAATNKLRAELQSSSGNMEEVAARHAEDLRSLEARLVAKFQSDVKAAVEQAKKEASQSAASTSTDDHEQAIKSAVERGRMEFQTKLKLKDTMLTKAQNNVKHLEAQIKAWREAGFIPSDIESSGTSATASATPVKATPAAATVTPGGQNTSTPMAAAGPSALPRKPSLSVATIPKSPVVATNPAPVPNPADVVIQNVRGGVRGRGVVRGLPGRGRAGAPIGRGGGPPSAATSSTGAAPPGMSIIGAAGKRVREDSGTPDSLAKRLKPVEVPGTKPVALRRPAPVTAPPS